MIVAGTGHRPDKLGGYGNVTPWVELAVEWLTALQPSEVISGMALGWDTYLALAALEMKVPLLAAVPFKGQESRWPEHSRALYRDILAQCHEIKIVSPHGYSVEAMHRRNRWMVDNCELVLACWDGSGGGTANCVNYAVRSRRHLLNCHPNAPETS